MNFLVALKTTIGSLLFKVLIPTHVYTLSQKIYIPWLTSALNNTTNAFESLRKHMLEIVSDARALGTTGSRESAVYPAWQGTTGYKVKSGLLANLVEANTAYGEGVFIGEKRRTLTEEELLSDTFVRSKTFSAESSIKQFIFRFSYLQDMVRSGYLDRLHLFKYPQQRLQPTLCVLPRYFSRSTQISKPRSCEKWPTFGQMVLQLRILSRWGRLLSNFVCPDVGVFWNRHLKSRLRSWWGLLKTSQFRYFRRLRSSIFVQEYTTAVIYEAIRMFPPVMRLGKHVTTDTHVKTKIFDNHSFEVLREVDVPIKAGSVVVLDILGLHMNRRLSASQTYELLFFSWFFSFLRSSCLGKWCWGF